MPQAVAIAIRYLIMAGVQLGIWSLIEKYGIPLFEYAVVSLMSAFGIPRQAAEDLMANEILDAFEQVGLFAVTLKSKLPVKAAERFGFTSKGYAKRVLPSDVAKKYVEAKKATIASKVVGATQASELGASIALGRGIKTLTVVSLLTIVMSVVSTSSNIILAAANVMDFGNWQGAYQKTFQKIFTALGFPPDSPIPKARTVSADTWNRIAATIEVLNPVGISYPFSGQNRLYTRENLADLVDELAANIVKDGGQATYKNVIGLALPLIQLGGQPDTSKLNTLNFGAVTSTSTPRSTQTTTTPTTKVFTGIVSQGVVGKGLVFEARPDDLIESVEELKQAAANNLAPFLAALPGRVTYEIKVVSSIVTKDGFKQTGTTQRIQTGTYSNGIAKYKTVTNKFATLVLYVMTDKGTRTKLTTINLGPTDAFKLQVGENDLRSIEGLLPSLVTTTNINDIVGIQSETPINVTTMQTGGGVTEEQKKKDEIDTGFRFYSFVSGGESYIEVLPWLGNVPFGYTPLTQREYLDIATKMMQTNPTRWTPYFADMYKKFPTALTTGNSGYVIRNGVPYKTENAPASGTAPAVSGTGSSSSKLGANAATLNEWFQMQGQVLPSVRERAKLYAQYGLGKEEFYVASAEQNTRLLNALKG